LHKLFYHQSAYVIAFEVNNTQRDFSC